MLDWLKKLVEFNSKPKPSTVQNVVKEPKIVQNEPKKMTEQQKYHDYIKLIASKHPINEINDEEKINEELMNEMVDDVNDFNNTMDVFDEPDENEQLFQFMNASFPCELFENSEKKEKVAVAESISHLELKNNGIDVEDKNDYIIDDEKYDSTIYSIVKINEVYKNVFLPHLNKYLNEIQYLPYVPWPSKATNLNTRRLELNNVGWGDLNAEYFENFTNFE